MKYSYLLYISLIILSTDVIFALDDVFDVTQNVKPNFLEKVGLFFTHSIFIKILQVLALTALVTTIIIIGVIIYKKLIKK